MNPRSKTWLLASVPMLLCLCYSLLVHPQLRQRSQEFLQERSRESLQTFTLLSLTRGIIEVAKQIPGVNALAGRAAPMQDLLDMLWYSSLFSLIFNQILQLYISTNIIFSLSMSLVIVFLSASLGGKLCRISQNHQKFCVRLLGQLCRGLSSHPLSRTVYHSALLAALILPLYIWLSLQFYQHYHRNFVAPKYEAIAAMFAAVAAVDQKIQAEQQQKLQTESRLQSGLTEKTTQLEELRAQLEELKKQLPSRWWFQSKSPEEQEREAQYTALQRRQAALQKAIRAETRQLAGSQGLVGAWNAAIDYFAAAKDYAGAYAKGFIQLMSSWQILRSYIFQSLILSGIYFIILPLALLCVVRSMFKNAELLESRRWRQDWLEGRPISR